MFRTRTETSTPLVMFHSRSTRRIHNGSAPEEGCGHATAVDVFSGVNETPLLRGIEFTHAPSQGWIKDVWNGAERQGETLQKSERWIAADDYE